MDTQYNYVNYFTFTRINALQFIVHSLITYTLPVRLQLLYTYNYDVRTLHETPLLRIQQGFLA